MKVTAIDVSYCQTGVDYNKVKNSGIDAVIIRAGFGKETYQKDSEFETHYRNAKKQVLRSEDIGTLTLTLSQRQSRRLRYALRALKAKRLNCLYIMTSRRAVRQGSVCLL